MREADVAYLSPGLFSLTKAFAPGLAQHSANIVKLIVANADVSVPRNVPAHHALFSLTPPSASQRSCFRNRLLHLQFTFVIRLHEAQQRSDTSAGAAETRRTTGCWSLAHKLRQGAASSRDRSFMRQELDFTPITWTGDKTNRTPSTSHKAEAFSQQGML